jgi:hypothetical protein
VGIVHHYRVGYPLILLTPVLSYIIFLLFPGVYDDSGALPRVDSLVFIWWQISTIALLTIGVALYLYGYLKREATNADEVTLILGFSFILIFWGGLNYLLASGILADQIWRSTNPGVLALTIWDYLRYWVWELNAILWVGAGSMLIVTSLLKIRNR